MNYDIHIENLGAIKEANITITPMTILAGENGTGKSFVTKFLYSVLNALSINVYSRAISKTTYLLEQSLKSLSNTEIFDKNELETLKHFQQTIDSISLYMSQINFNVFSIPLEEFISKLSSELDKFNNIITPKLIQAADLQEEINIQKQQYSHYEQSVAKNTRDLLFFLLHPKDSYKYLFKKEIINELKENFQISELNALIKFNEACCSFSVENYLLIKIFKNNELEVNLLSLPSLSNLIFFESPVYWKLLALIPTKGFGMRFFINEFRPTETLTGVPKHFLDLKELLFTNFKDGERPDFIIECANKLQEQLKGKFNASNGDLTFENEKGQSISKNLVSFGMTNIGIIQAVLSKNIINKGSFVFIDEPESNLHPEWQAILANVLVHLAKNGVYVIVTTHSSDMLKAFDISTQEQEVNEELSTYYFKSDGTLLNMIDDEFTPIEQARRKLLETYENLMIRGYLL